MVEGNYIGTNASGTAAVANQYGVHIDSALNNTIGGTAAGAQNVISGNSSYGVYIYGTTASGNVVKGNYIGTNATGTAAVANQYGVYLYNASSNTIGGTVAGAANVISGNTSYGVGMIWAATGNAVRGNAIYANGGLGIDLNCDGVTLNDLGDADTGPNNRQNFPVLSGVGFGAQTKIDGTLNSLPNAAYTLDFYANAAAGPFGYGEGQRYLGSTAVTTNATGNVAFSVTLAAASSPGEWITATATDAAGNTSELSATMPAQSIYTVTNTWDSGYGSLRQAITLANLATVPVTISFNIPATDPHFQDDDATLPGGDPGPDVFVFDPLAPLPAINNPNYAITIDGTTQTTFGGDTNPFGPEIVLDGFVGGVADGLDIYSANNTVEGSQHPEIWECGD